MNCRDIGPLDARIMLIGEAPGAEEEKDGIPFIGQAGKLLKSMCYTAGIDYDKCYVTNICAERPPGNNFGYFYEDAKRSVPKDSLRKAWAVLGDKIRTIRPVCVIALGDEPLRAITNLQGIGSWRGTRIEAYGTKVIATYHPANILREYSNRVIAEMDLRKAKRESEGLIYEQPDINIKPSITDVVTWINWARFRKRSGFDIETIGKRIRCIAIAVMNDFGRPSAICIPFINMINSSAVSFSSLGNTITANACGDINYWSAADEEIVLEQLASILENESIEKVGQNSISFDAPLIEEEFGITIKNHKQDLMHAWHVLYPPLLKGLDFISSVLTDHPNYWTLHDPSVDESEWKYNCMDAIVTLESSIKVDKELEDEKLKDLYYNHVHPLAFCLLDAQRKGVLFDSEEAAKLEKILGANLEGIKKGLSQFVGEDFNPNSPKQVGQLIYEKLKFPVVFHKDSKKPTTNEDALLRLAAKYPTEPMLEMIVQYRKIQKLLSTYVRPKIDEDNRIRCSYNPSGTITGRISSSKTIWGTGMDLHNIPKGHVRGSENTRHLYIAAPGNVFVVGDLKQAEAMVVAWLLKSLGDPTLYDLYHNPAFDIHRWCAAFVYSIIEQSVTYDQRQRGKLANHSGNYMAGPRVMETKARSDGLKGMTYAVCKEILERRNNAIPGLRMWWADVERKIKQTRMLTTCFGRRLQFFGRLEGEELRSAIAFEPQSTVGDVCNEMFIKLSNHSEHWPVLTTHDEIVLETPKLYAHKAATRMLEASRIPLALRPNLEPLIIPIEIRIGKNWRDHEEWKPNA